ncbi:hypothetical protein Tco_0075993, partial [Tanacetum coccineum]
MGRVSSPSDSLSDTLSVHSSGFDASGQTHSGPSTRVASSRSAPLSTPYPPTTSESSPNSSSERSLDLSSLFAGPSRKRCRSLITSVPSSAPVSRPIVPTHADLLPPRKRFRDSYSPKDSREEHMEIGMGVYIAASDIRDDEEEFEAEASAGGTVEVEVDPRVRPVVDEDVPDHVTVDGAIEVTYETLGDLVQRFHDHTEEIPVHRIQVIKIAQRQLEAGQMI